MTSTPGRLDSRQLAAMYHELDRDKVRSAHASSTGEPDVGLIAKMDALSAEIKRRASEGEGDPYLLTIEAKVFAADAARLPPTEPVGASVLTPEALQALNDRDLRTAFEQMKSQLELHNQAYGEIGDNEIVGGVAKLDFSRTAIVRFRKKGKEVLQALASEMLRRGMRSAHPATSAPSHATGPKESGDVAKRRAIVRGAGSLSVEDICKRLDMDSVPVPDHWENARTWSAAVKSRQYRSNVHTTISKDRRHRRRS